MSQLNDAVMLKNLDRLISLSDQVDFHGAQQQSTEAVFLLAAQYSSPEILQWFLDQNPSPEIMNTAARRAVYAENLDGFKLFLSNTKNDAEYSSLFSSCAAHNFIVGMGYFDMNKVTEHAAYGAMIDALADENHDVIGLLFPYVCSDSVEGYYESKQMFADDEDIDATLNLYRQYQKSFEEYTVISKEVISQGCPTSRISRKI